MDHIIKVGGVKWFFDYIFPLASPILQKSDVYHSLVIPNMLWGGDEFFQHLFTLPPTLPFLTGMENSGIRFKSGPSPY